MHVFHQLDRLLKGLCAQTLVDIADTLPGLVVVGAIGIVDVTRSVGCGTDKVSAHIEELRNFFNVVHRRSWLVCVGLQRKRS